MRSVRRVALLVVPAALALSACGIPATGVVEAGGPASGIPATTALYFVGNGTLVAVPRAVPEAGDVGMAVEALLQGPTARERLKHLTTRLVRLPERTTLFPTAGPAETRDGGSPGPTATGDPSGPSPDVVRVTAHDDHVAIRLPSHTSKLTELAADQVICTAARAYLLGLRDAEPATVTVTVTGADGRRFEGSGARCPGV
ncbi:hypothetical protein ACFY30_10400 [Streptomyces sp. NPDC000345]|uniref:hypothetical protein n=1 Tax=Streptomyces sp. NPDC000345 TaxID=3364537 RepID=UPI0036C0501F